MSWIMGFTLGFFIPLNLASFFLSRRSLSKAFAKI